MSISSSHQRLSLGVPNDFFSLVSQTKILSIFIISPCVLHAHLAHCLWFCDFNILWYKYKSRSSWLSSFLNPLAAMVIQVSVFWDKTPCSQLKVNRRFGETCRFQRHLLHADFLLGSSFALKMEATCPAETSVNFQRTTRRCIPKNRTLFVLLLL
jgi:hypothetical protein